MTASIEPPSISRKHGTQELCRRRGGGPLERFMGQQFWPAGFAFSIGDCIVPPPKKLIDHR